MQFPVKISRKIKSLTLMATLILLQAYIAKATPHLPVNAGYTSTAQDIPTIDVKSTGAAGNGTQDDYPAIAKAISQATGPVKIHFPAGSYLIKQDVETKHDGTSFIFDKGAKIIMPDNAGSGFLLLNNDCSVIGGYFEGNGESSKSMSRGYGVMLYGVANCRVINCTFNKISGVNILLLNHGDKGCSKSNITGNTIINPAFQRNIVQDAAAIMIGYSGDGYFHTDNTVTDNKIDGNETLAHGIAMITHGSGTLIAKNEIKNCLRYGIVVYNSSYQPNTLKNNTIVYNTVSNIGDPKKPNPFGMGIYLMECQHSVVRGNHVSNVLINTDRTEILPPGAISLNGSANCVVDSNVIQNSNKYGITISQSFNTPVTNNTITNTAESGIYLMNTNDNLISDNTLKGINKYIVKGFFVNTGKKGFDWLNLDEYKNVATGKNIEIKNNTFFSNSPDATAISMKGDVADPTKNGVDNKVQGVQIHDNTFHVKQKSANFIHYDQEEGGSNKAFNNKMVQD